MKGGDNFDKNVHRPNQRIAFGGKKQCLSLFPFGDKMHGKCTKWLLKIKQRIMHLDTI